MSICDDDYLLAIGQLIEACRDLDLKLFGCCQRVFGLNIQASIAIFGPGDPKRKSETIKRFLSEVCRDKEAEVFRSWSDISKRLNELVTERNNIIHSMIVSQKEDERIFLRLASVAPKYQAGGGYLHHGGFSTYTNAEIITASAKMGMLSEEISKFLQTHSLFFKAMDRQDLPATDG